jgi:hypothetical protein
LGKYRPASADSHSYAESFAVSRRKLDVVSGAIAIGITNICISHSESGWSCSCRTGKPDADANNSAS